ncbi:winged helix-turn-helix domain-containing protein [Pseudoalteromonas luteoviolacea]|uniref:winged helix-turn-helix domain-containing protein n=1 Tax=Pseudoalteromonas luteoviolacea TaxID=43657 RepID=UPI001EEE0D90|nr:winged helix-turn-helix domain-containing protein [Pseudoalteromonas luteoviolacea]MCF6438420.1 winged helix-turn-helix domain-containing protein [Pseudoalteromonas luteoviolacea]
MQQQYWVDDFYIDVSRNQITYQDHTQTLAPKALAVLTVLAKHQGEVLSQDTLLDAVWPDVIVSPNTLQRSIAQLRKAFGDDGKAQGFIKTHAKQGYSLEANVQWGNNKSKAASLSNMVLSNNAQLEHALPAKQNTPQNDKNSASTFKFAYAAVGGLLAIGALALLYKPQPQTLNITKLTALTATDNRENAGIYSPDGDYVVFHRYEDRLCINNIWAKNTQTQAEFQLTQQLKSNGTHTFSADGNTLYFVQEQDCRQPITQKLCYQLMSLDFAKSLISPQQPTTLMECKNSRLRAPNWMNGGSLALLQQHDTRWELIRYAIESKESQIIYGSEDDNVISYAYSKNENLIALTTVNTNNEYHLVLVSPQGKVRSKTAIQYPTEIARYRFIYPSFSPLDEKLVFSTGRQLFTLSYDGQIENVSLPLDEPMGSPNFHPDGDRILVIKGFYDRDIASFSFAQPTTVTAQTDNTFPQAKFDIIERSISSEGSAVFQPNGDKLAFRSQRSGIDQVWISDGQSSQQLSNFAMDSYIEGLVWSQDGQSLMANSAKALYQLALDRSTQHFAFPMPIEQLFDWDSEQQTALANIRVAGLIQFAQLDLRALTYTILREAPVNWAQYSDNKQIIYTDQLDRFWQTATIEDTFIDALITQGSDKRFVFKNSTLYGVNEQFQFWRYNLSNEQFEVLTQLPKTLDYLTDVRGTTALISLRINAKKELAELTISN